MRRRQFLASAAMLAGSAAIARAPALAAGETATTDASHAIPHLLDGFLKLPGKKSAQVDVDEATTPWRVTSEPDAELFVGSCFKTFVLTAYLQEVEAGRLDEIRAACGRRQRALAGQPRSAEPHRHDAGAQRAGGDDRAQRQHGNRHRPEAGDAGARAPVHQPMPD